jgi:curved DNA-binding protein CbpA
MLIKTHYDNLNVAKNAPSDIIRAAYKSILQTCDADLSPNADASRFLKIINDSFAVLSNPVQRAAYDQWLIEQESIPAEKRKHNSKFTYTHKTKQPDKIITTESTNSKNNLAKPEISDSADKKQSNYLPWLIYAGIALAIFLALKWFGVLGGESESTSDQSAQNLESATQQELISPPKASQDTEGTLITEPTQSAVTVVASSVPEHDQVTIDQFIGVWKGNNGETGGQQTLDISLKSEHSIVFNLDAKSGKSVGGVYGIAAFANSYANFYNKEYNCSILFTIKLGTLQLNTSSCQAYHETGISFDGKYSKPTLAKVDALPNVVKPKLDTKNIPAKIYQTKPVETSPAVAINAPKLLKFVVTVKDATGKTSKIELIAKDKEAAKAIIRDFRGNPDIVRIKEVRN